MLLALSAGGLAAYGVRGATKNYAQADGLFGGGVAWMYAVLLVAAAGLVAVAVTSAVTAVTWPSIPRWQRPLLARTPLGEEPIDPRDRRHLGVLLLGWAAVLAGAAAAQFVFTVSGAPQLLADFDEELSAVGTGSGIPWEWLGTAPVAVGLAVVVGLVSLRCPTFALSQLTVVVAALVVHGLFTEFAPRAHPPDGPLAGLTDSLPSAAILQAIGTVRLAVDGLVPDTAYEYIVEVDGVPDRSRGAGAFTTMPEGPASFTLAVGACARTGSSGAVFDAIRAVDPLLYLQLGDLDYGNIARDDVAAFGDRYRDVLTAPAQAALYRSVPVAYAWGDHDFGGNDADSTSPSRFAAREAYRRYVPHHELIEGDGGAVYHAFTVGRVRVVMTDTRSERTATSMLGDRQLAWLEEELVTAGRDHALVIWANPDPWVAPDEPGRDDWGGFAAERRGIADVIAGAGIDNLVMVSADAHMLAIDDGTNIDYSSTGGAGFPLLHAAALDRPGSFKGGPYSEGAFPGPGQLGTVTVTDDGGDTVDVALAGRNWRGEVVVSLRTTLPG